MAAYNIAYLGGRILGYRCLEILHSFCEEHSDKLKLCFVVPHTEEGKFTASWNVELKPLARQFGMEVYEPATLKDPAVWQRFRDEGVNLLLNAFCNRIIPKEILTLPSLQAINFHYGKLPEYQGRFIVTNIIFNQEKETRATAHYIDATVDGGDIIMEERVPVNDNDTAETLYMRCTDASVDLFENIMKTIVAGKPLPRKKQTGTPHYFEKEMPNRGQVDLAWDRERIERFIRAVSFEPVSRPWLEIAQQRYEIRKA